MTFISELPKDHLSSQMLQQLSIQPSKANSLVLVPEKYLGELLIWLQILYLVSLVFQRETYLKLLHDINYMEKKSKWKWRNQDKILCELLLSQTVLSPENPYGIISMDTT